jgi:phosphoglycolate phosphatase
VTAPDAVVYDLDGTLVELDVDWDAVTADVLAVYRDAGVDPPSESLWDLVDRAAACGVGDAVETAVADHERAGARRSTRLRLADALAGDDRPTAVCSLNCEAACRIALESHGLTDRVAAVVGRDSVAEQKPDPGALRAALDRLGVAPDRAVFVGDSESDAVAAERAGVAFVPAAEWGPD